MNSPRILIVSGSAGHGHVMAARALEEAVREREPNAEVLHLDALTKMSTLYARIYKWAYLQLVDKHPHLWRIVYESTDREISRLGHAITIWMGHELVRACKAWKPDVIACTHFLAPEVLDRALRKAGLETPVHCVVTDHDIHRNWYWPCISKYYVASPLVQGRLHLRYGVPLERTLVTGIPVRAQFRSPTPRDTICARHGLDPARPIVLFLSGGFAAGPFRQAILGIWGDRRDAQIVAVSGRNIRMKRRIEALPRPAGAVLRALGFVEDVGSLMNAADLVVGKSGGITTSECLATGTPLIVSNAIAGQEERNALMLTETGAGAFAPTAEEVRWRVTCLLEDPAALAAMAAAARTSGAPEAALTIADDLLKTAGGSSRQGRPHFHGAA